MRYLWSLAPASSPSRAAPSAISWSTSHRMCGRQVLRNAWPKRKTASSVPPRRPSSRPAPPRGSGRRRSPAIGSRPPCLRRTASSTSRRRGAPSSLRPTGRASSCWNPRCPPDGPRRGRRPRSAARSPPTRRPRPGRLERVDVDVRRVGGHRHREQARVRAHVEERVGPSSERGHRVQRQPIVGVRPTARPQKSSFAFSQRAGSSITNVTPPTRPLTSSRWAGAGSRPARSDGATLETSRRMAFGARRARKRLTNRFRPNQLRRRAWRSTRPSFQGGDWSISPGSTS